MAIMVRASSSLWWMGALYPLHTHDTPSPMRRAGLSEQHHGNTHLGMVPVPAVETVHRSICDWRPQCSLQTTDSPTDQSVAGDIKASAGGQLAALFSKETGCRALYRLTHRCSGNTAGCATHSAHD